MRIVTCTLVHPVSLKMNTLEKFRMARKKEILKPINFESAYIKFYFYFFALKLKFRGIQPFLCFL